MKTTTTFFLITTLLFITNVVFAQTVVKQYTGGKKGVVMNASSALGNDLSKHSTLNLKPEATEASFVYQNFVFSSESEKGTKVTFVVRTDQKCDLKVLNMKLFTLLNNNASDTLTTEEIQIAKINEDHNVYEFSFITNKNFDTAGLMICGGGDFQTVKIYKVYVATNATASIF